MPLILHTWSLNFSKFSHTPETKKRTFYCEGHVNCHSTPCTYNTGRTDEGRVCCSLRWSWELSFPLHKYLLWWIHLQGLHFYVPPKYKSTHNLEVGRFWTYTIYVWSTAYVNLYYDLFFITQVLGDHGIPRKRKEHPVLRSSSQRETERSWI